MLSLISLHLLYSLHIDDASSHTQGSSALSQMCDMLFNSALWSGASIDVFAASHRPVNLRMLLYFQVFCNWEWLLPYHPLCYWFLWHLCFACRESGDLIKDVNKKHSLGSTFFSSFRKLRSKSSVLYKKGEVSRRCPRLLSKYDCLIEIFLMFKLTLTFKRWTIYSQRYSAKLTK